MNIGEASERSGLPAKTTLVAIGQDYLNDGVKVRPVAQGGARP